MVGEGEPAGDQDLLRASLPFGRQREQRELQRADTEIREEGHGHREDRTGRDREDQPEHQCQAERNPRLGQRGVFLREHALEGRSPKGGYVPPKEVIPFLFRFTNQFSLKGCHDKKKADKIIRDTYKTLLTRGQKGCYIYCEDKRLASYIKKCLKQS